MILRFPEIQITNSRKNKHTIKNLFVNLTFSFEKKDNKYKIRLSSISGTRLTVTNEEYNYGYAHSHIGTIDYTSPYNRCSYSNFCQGNGGLRLQKEVINQEVSIIDFNKEIMEDLDLNNFILMLGQIKNYVRWESLSGIPYKRIASIGNKTDIPSFSINDLRSKSNEALGRFNPKFKTYDQVFDSYLNSDYVRFKPWEYYNEPKIEVNWRIDNGKYLVIDDDKLEDLFLFTREQAEKNVYLSTNLSTLRDDELYVLDEGYYYFRDEEGVYWKESTIQQREVIPNNEDSFLIFDGEKRFFTVETVEEFSPITNQRKYIHPQIKEYVKQQLEYTANKKAYESYRSRTKDKPNSSKKVHGQSEVLL